MRDQLLKALLAHAQGDIQKHVANVEVYLQNPAGIGEHSNIVEAIEQELDIIAKYHDQVEVINKYFKGRSSNSHPHQAPPLTHPHTRPRTRTHTLTPAHPHTDRKSVV